MLILAGLLAQGCGPTGPTPGPAPNPQPTTRPDMSDAMDMSSDMAEGDMAMPADMMEPDEGMMPEDMPPDMCEPESTLQFCMRNNYSCGELVAEDNCGEMRTEVCGETCSLPQTCVQSVDDNDVIQSSSCACDFDSVEAVCDSVGKLCGPLSPPCGDMMCDNFCVDSVAVGADFSCALGSNKLRCWGRNNKGQLGIGSTQTQKNPTPLDLELKAVSMATGHTHSCAILDDTSLICWGDNSKGQLGIRTTVDQPFPDLVNPNSRAFAQGVHKVVLGNEHTCALVDDDFDPANDLAPKAPFSAYCWGSNALGAIGNIDRVILGADSGAPVLVTGLKDNVIDLDAGYGHNCAITESAAGSSAREISCWGLDEGGQLGTRHIQSATLYELNDMGRRIKDGDGNDIPTGFYQHYMYNEPANNRLIVIPSPAKVRSDKPSASVTTESNVNQSPTVFTGEFEEIVAGESISCVRRADNSMACWGVLPFTHDPTTCKLPLYDTPPSVDPVNVGECTAWPPIQQWDSVTIPMIKTPATNTTDYGLPQTSIEFRAFAPRPTEIEHHPTDPTVYPSYLTGGEEVRVTQMSAHGDHVCVLLDDAQYLPPAGSAPSFTNVHCFGNNDTGQLGDSTNSPIGYPIKLATDVDGQIVRGAEVGVGGAHSCVVADNNNIKCWGSNKESQLGNENLLKDESFRPFDVLLR